MNIVIPKANTHSDVAKEQHLVPRTYMRQWSYNNTERKSCATSKCK